MGLLIARKIIELFCVSFLFTISWSTNLPSFEVDLVEFDAVENQEG